MAASIRRDPNGVGRTGRSGVEPHTMGDQTMRTRANWFETRLLVLCACAACSARGDDNGRGNEGPPPTSGTESSGAATTTSSGTTSDTGDTSDAGTDGHGTGETDGCGPAQICGEICCGTDEVCDAGACQPVCPDGSPACGPGAECCDGGQVCHLAQCLTPGDPCTGTVACATRTEIEQCPAGQVCDASLELCIPDLGSTSCTYVPPPAIFDPVPLFTWGQRRARSCSVDADCQTQETCSAGSCVVTWSHVDVAGDELPDYFQVSSIPLVTDLDGDCVPEIVFNTYRDSDFTEDGVLRAIRGDTGASVWTLDDPNYRTDGTGNPAIGDLDGDGTPEVVAQGEGNYLVAVAADGAPLWRSDEFVGGENSGSVAIANLDGEGEAEIIFGAAVYDWNGALLWEGSGGIGRQGQGPISCVADLDADGRPEVIGGNTAYAFTGTVGGGDLAGSEVWTSTAPDGYCGIADLDGVPGPEVVLVSQGTVHVLAAVDGSVRASLPLPGGGKGGAPNIADFDGDGRPDIGTAGGNNYAVFTFNGDALSLLWQAQTEDDSSSRTGSSVFDFDGDGRSEVVYNDEEYLRIYPGVEPDCVTVPVGPACDGVMTDDEVLFRDLNSSRTRTEYPVIADVNGDFKAEIVFSTNNEASSLDPSLVGDAGIEIWRDRTDNWVPTRPVWNQHTYHVDNVRIDGSIPVTEPEPSTSYRRNTQGEVAFCAPDLVPRDLAGEQPTCAELELTAWVLNQGCLGVGPGINVAFYDAGAGLLGVVRTRGALGPGGAEKVRLPVAPPGDGPFSITVVVDDDGTGGGSFNECNEDNNGSDPLEMCAPVG